MSKIFLAIFSVYTDFQTTCLCITKVGAASYLKVFLLSWRPCFNIQGFHFQVCQVTRAAFQCTNRNIQGTKQINSVLPQFVKPHLAVLWIANYDHLLLLKLVDTVNASLFKSMSTFLFTEAWRITCKSFWKLFFRNDLVNKFTNHRMLTGSDQVQILTFDLVHHGIHLSEAHNTCNNVTSDHERRYTVCESSVNHEITCICNNCRMKSCDIPHQIIETITSNTSCAIKVDSVKSFHDFCMIRNFEVRNNRFTKFLNLNVLAVIFTNRYRWVNDIRDYHHILQKLFLNFFLSLGKFLNTLTGSCNLFLNFLCFILLSLAHKSTNLFGNFISLCTKSFYFLFDLAVFLIQLQNLVNQLQFAILEFIADVLLYDFRVLSHKFDV